MTLLFPSKRAVSTVSLTPTLVPMKSSRLLGLLAAGLLPALAFAQTYSFTAAELGFIYGKSLTTATTNPDGSYTLRIGSNTEFLVGYLPTSISGGHANILGTGGNSVSLSMSWTENPNSDLAQSTMRVGFFDPKGMGLPRKSGHQFRRL